MKYLKRFNQHSDYNTYITGLDKLLPNVSYCENENEVHFNPYTDPKLIVKYTVEDDSEPTMLYSYYTEEGDEEYWVRGIDLFDKIEIDGVEVSISDIDEEGGYYDLSEGEHTAIYTLKDPTTTGNYVFCECSGITNIVIPDSVTTIGDAVFQSCTGLTSVIIGNGVTTIGNSAFDNCSNLTSITIPDSVTTIGVHAFSGCSSLTGVTIGNSVTTISERAFYKCSGLTDINIPNSVTTIGDYAFDDCSFDTMTIGNGITSIGASTLATIMLTIITAITPPALPNGFFFTPVMNGNNNLSVIQVPSASVAAYKAASGWSDYADIIQAIP